MYFLILVCIDCIACMVLVLLVWCIQTCICLYKFVCVCIYLYYVPMESMLVFHLPIHANTYQYISIRTAYKTLDWNTCSILSCLYLLYWHVLFSQIQAKYMQIQANTDPILSWRAKNLWSLTPPYWYVFVCIVYELGMYLLV